MLPPATDEEEREALNLKYNQQVNVFRLSTGRYALFDHWSSHKGLPLIAIGTWAELEPFVIEASARLPEPEPAPPNSTHSPQVARGKPTTDALLDQF